MEEQVAEIKGESEKSEDKAAFREVFLTDVLSGLSASPKTLPSRYIYDKIGSRLFEKIMNLEEYYLTRCEFNILSSHSNEITRHFGNERFNLIELGAGNGKKTSILIDYLLKSDYKFRYVPVDISSSAVTQLEENLKVKFPDLESKGLVMEYFDALKWVKANSGRKNMVLFLGSNIGNFNPERRVLFLTELRNSLKSGDKFLLGVDLKKDPDILNKAYNDSKGITKDFNLNLLKRINKELEGSFDLSSFRFYSRYNPLSGAVESFLISTRSQKIRIGKEELFFDKWEPIHTESSYKYTLKELDSLAEDCGFRVVQHITDDQGYFADTLWEVK